MGLFSSKPEKKKPLFTVAQREKARRTRELNKEKAAEAAKELEDLRIFKENSVAEAKELAAEVKAKEAKAEREHKVEVEKLNIELTAVKERNKVLEEIADDANEVTKREILVDKREKLFEAQEEANATFQEEVVKLKEGQEEVKQTSYKSGYADGLSDGIRKGVDSAQEDRKMLASVAMMSAASHTPAAAEIVAENMKNALPATTGTKNK